MSKEHLESPPPKRLTKRHQTNSPWARQRCSSLWLKLLPLATPPLATGQRIPIQ